MGILLALHVGSILPYHVSCDGSSIIPLTMPLLMGALSLPYLDSSGGCTAIYPPLRPWQRLFRFVLDYPLPPPAMSHQMDFFLSSPRPRSCFIDGSSIIPPLIMFHQIGTLLSLLNISIFRCVLYHLSRALLVGPVSSSPIMYLQKVL